MGKGSRRLTTSRSERLFGSYSKSSHHFMTATDVSELGEEDIWSIVDNLAGPVDQIKNNSQEQWNRRSPVESVENSEINRFHRDGRHTYGLSVAFEDSSPSRILHQFHAHVDNDVASLRQIAMSVPMKVPDWSKIMRNNPVELNLNLDKPVEDDDDSEILPPHEYLAREYARSKKMSAGSVFEGVGRTLKGRDLRRVRDAVWSHTGFDG